MQQYESTFIVDAHLSDDVIEKTIDKFKKVMEEGGATIHNIDRWGKRRLAYEIARKQYGYYVYIRFEAEGAFIQELEREYKLDDTILRTLTVVVPVAALRQEKRDEEKRAAEIEEKEKREKAAAAPSEEDKGKENSGESETPTEAEAPSPVEDAGKAEDGTEKKE